MSLSIGIVGLPNAGKSTLFNALLQRHQAKVASHPFTTIEPNVGVVEIPDDRLKLLAKQLTTNNIQPTTVPATIEFIDIAGLIKNAHKGEGLGNQFLGHIREVDAIIHILDGFSKDANPEEAKDIVNIELELAGIKKPTLYVLNVAEEKLNDNHPTDAIAISAKMEEELTDLPENEARDYLKASGQTESGLVRLIQKSNELLDLLTFYTIKKDMTQVQAWNIKKATKAPEAAAKIHTDFAKGFIAAEIINWQDLISTGGWQKAKETGKIRSEGKEYQIQDGDVVLFRFQV